MNGGTPWFRGNVRLKLDAKGRVKVPRGHRISIVETADASAPGVVITRDEFEPCLVVHPASQWMRIEAEVCDRADALRNASPEDRARAQRACRRLIGSTVQVPFDAQGRVLIPRDLRDEVGLCHAVRLVGVGERFELWSEEAWCARSDAGTAPERSDA